MGLRHLIIVDGELSVVGMITRADMNEHKLHEYWHHQVNLSSPLFFIQISRGYILNRGHY